MTQPLVIIGAGETGQMLYEGYLTPDYRYRLMAFAVEDADGPEAVLGVPVVSFHGLRWLYPPKTCQVFVAISGNAPRRRLFEQVKAWGYTCPSFIHPTARLGLHAQVGENVWIQEYNNIQYHARVGDNCILWASWNHVGHRSVIGAHSFLAANVTVNGWCDIGEECYLGSSVTVRDEVKIGPQSIVGQGANVVKNLPGRQTYVGNPARALEA